MPYTLSANTHSTKSDTVTRTVLHTRSTAVSVSLVTDLSIKLPTGAAGTAVDLGSITTASYVEITSTQDIGIVLNSGDETFDLNAGGILLLVKGAVTSINLSNDSGSAATVLVTLGGE